MTQTPTLKIWIGERNLFSLNPVNVDKISLFQDTDSPNISEAQCYYTQSSRSPVDEVTGTSRLAGGPPD